MEQIRLADRCIVTGQPLFCPECGSPLGKSGQCTDSREKCLLYWKETQPFPDYDDRGNN
jgi:hypothetical protein